MMKTLLIPFICTILFCTACSDDTDLNSAKYFHGKWAFGAPVTTTEGYDLTPKITFGISGNLTTELPLSYLETPEFTNPNSVAVTPQKSSWSYNRTTDAITLKNWSNSSETTIVIDKKSSDQFVAHDQKTGTILRFSRIK